MSNSKLVNYTRLSPNHSGRRTHSIDRITPHCVVGQCSVETLGEIFAVPSRKASCQYGIGSDGRIGLYCDEANRSWCSSSPSNDQRAVTIECASDTAAPFAFRPAVYEALVRLCADICRRNGKTRLLWLETKEKALAYSPAPDEMVLTVHRWFANKSCPGDWMMARMQLLADRVNRLLKEETEMSNLEIKTLIEETVQAAVDSLRKELLARLAPVTYDSVDEVPEWAKDAVRKRVKEGVLEGSGHGLGLTVDLLRTWVVLDREEALREAAESYGMD